MSEESEPTTRITAVRSISHDKDVDGLASAAIVWRYAKKRGFDYSVTLTDYGSFETVFPGLSALRNTLLVMTDLGMDVPTMNQIVGSLSRAISQGCRIVWLDHHQWKEAAMRALLSLGNRPILKIRHDLCAAEIAYRVLMPDDSVSGELAEIAHDTDFNMREIEAATALTDALSVLRFAAIDRREDVTATLLPLLRGLADSGLSSLWDDVNKRFRDDLLEKRVQNYRKEKVKKMRKALAGHQDLEIHDRLVRVVELPSGVTTTDMGTFVVDQSNLDIDGQKLPLADLLVTVSPGGMLGFRRGRDNVLCDKAAALFEGGGHPYAAGGEYGLYDDIQAVGSDIFVTLSKSRDWVASEQSKTD